MSKVQEPQGAGRLLIDLGPLLVFFLVNFFAPVPSVLTIFFAFMAVLNEAVWRNSSTIFWIGFKLWGALPLTFLFAAANIPMLLRHGLMKEDAVPAEPGPVE